MFKGNPITLGGPEIKAGSDAPDFTAVDNGLQPVKLSQAKGKVIVLSAVPSLDTPVCDTETRRFNQEAGKLGANVEVWTVSMDLPFAQKRWCGAAGATAVKTLSDFRERSFAQSYGVLVKEGPLAGLTARAYRSTPRFEKRVSWLVMNSSSAACPPSVAFRARAKAPAMSSGRSTRSLQPPMARPMSA